MCYNLVFNSFILSSASDEDDDEELEEELDRLNFFSLFFFTTVSVWLDSTTVSAFSTYTIFSFTTEFDEVFSWSFLIIISLSSRRSYSSLKVYLSSLIVKSHFSWSSSNYFNFFLSSLALSFASSSELLLEELSTLELARSSSYSSFLIFFKNSAVSSLSFNESSSILSRSVYSNFSNWEISESVLSFKLLSSALSALFLIFLSPNLPSNNLIFFSKVLFESFWSRSSSLLCDNKL